MITFIDNGGTSIPILATGNGWLAVDKPVGMSVHNDPGKDLIAAAAVAIQSHGDLARQVDQEPAFGVHAVHRLDRDTSGVVLLACTGNAFRYFSDLFQKKSVKKAYTALLHGRLDQPGAQGTWTRSLTKAAGGRQRPAGTGPKLDCQTRYRVLAHTTHYSHVACEPVTGRKHQIRRHAKIAGHPVVGDRRYGSKRSIDYLKTRQGFTRLALHALAITLRVPGEAEPVRIESATRLPEAFQRLIEED